MVLQYASMKLGYTWSLPVAFAVYAVWWAIFAKMLAGRLGSLVGQHGYLDQNTPRDHVPDIKTTWTSVCFYHSFLFRVYQWQTPFSTRSPFFHQMVIVTTIIIRPLFGTFIAYNQAELPHLSWWLPINAFIHVCILDFYY